VRTAGIAELVRVTGRNLVITCPHGEMARRSDENFRRALEDRHRPIPPWVSEHQSHPYPTLENVVRDIGDSRDPRITAHYSEPMRVRSVLSATAARSKAAWAATNLVAGLLLPIVPRPERTNSYRFVLTAEFG
jgi:hypothetical protein